MFCLIAVGMEEFEGRQYETSIEEESLQNVLNVVASYFSKPPKP